MREKILVQNINFCNPGTVSLMLNDHILFVYDLLRELLFLLEFYCNKSDIHALIFGAKTSVVHYLRPVYNHFGTLLIQHQYT